MALGSGVNQALKEVATWGVVICIGVTAFAYHKEMAGGLSQFIQYAEDQYKHSFVSVPEKSNGFERRVEISPDNLGQYQVQGEINGRKIVFLADTGATYVALTHKTAEKIGLNPSTLNFYGRTETANGVTRVAPVTIDRIEIGHISIKNVTAVVAEPGTLSTNLLGMSFIRKLRHVEMTNGRLIFTQ